MTDAPNPKLGKLNAQAAFQGAVKLADGDLVLPNGIKVPNPDELKLCECCGVISTLRRVPVMDRRSGKTKRWAVICPACYETKVAPSWA